MGIALAALCYAELPRRSRSPAALHLQRTTFGELIAWVIGWDLVLEFTIGSAALANSFSGYLQTVLDGTAFQIPASLASAEDGLFNLRWYWSPSP